MYDDYPTVYETTLNDSFIYLLIFGIITLILFITSLIALAKIFKKANRSGISAFIPIYNIITLLEITNTPKVYLLLFLIPGINIVANILVMISLAKFFRKGKAFGIGLALLPIVFYPILAFGNSEYIGINLTALGGKTAVADIPKEFQAEKKDVVVHEEKDTASKNINISIGGGVYQKDYTKSLLNVDEKQTIANTTPPVDLIPKIAKPVSQTFIKPVEEEPVPISEPTTMGIDFPTKINENINQVPPIIENPNTMGMNNINNGITSNQVPLTGTVNINQQSVIKEQPKIEVPNNQSLQNSEYISCPKCGAKIKRGVKVCFLCGRRLD